MYYRPDDVPSNFSTAIMEIKHTFPNHTAHSRKRKGLQASSVPMPEAHSFPNVTNTRRNKNAVTPRHRPKRRTILKSSNTAEQPEIQPRQHKFDIDLWNEYDQQPSTSFNSPDSVIARYFQLLLSSTVICVRVHHSCWALEHWDAHSETFKVICLRLTFYLLYTYVNSEIGKRICTFVSTSK